MTEEQVACKPSSANRCMFIHEFEISDVLQSSNPYCPIVDLKIMEDDGKGNVLSSVKIDPENLKIETHDSAHGRWAMLELDTSVAAEKLLAGQKLNYVLVGKTVGTDW